VRQWDGGWYLADGVAPSDHAVIYAHEIELWGKLFMNKAHTQE